VRSAPPCLPCQAARDRGHDGERDQLVRSERPDAAGVAVEDVAVRRPTLDDVFFDLTGHAAEVVEDEDDVVAVDGAEPTEDAA
jgi:hypothetical protein